MELLPLDSNALDDFARWLAELIAADAPSDELAEAEAPTMNKPDAAAAPKRRRRGKEI